ncbi:MFS transporter [Mesorhizobium sp. YR577]|jgi:MFS family permease|uniref:MFS transporter n=1 Tax=Mesorhizobium sp. YR577 TaxID=1884373 RepID=UPI0008F06C67|nr:MFS transporter [Mesorhizobium sp. YR577]SFT47751.1 Predicted arabinose efflux permease, MFS family [Mesorhizobium sp. YR577]
MKMFSALKHKNYRLLWLGILISNTGDWMDLVALNWFVLVTTGSSFYLGLVNLSRGLPILIFTLIGGVAADHFERRRLMMVTQATAMVLAFVLAGIVYSGGTNISLILMIATARGIVISFNLPARHSLISTIVPREDLPNAIALSSVTLNLTKVIGPSIAGIFIGLVGTAGCFLINGISFLVVLWSLGAMRIVADPVRQEKLSILRGIGEALIYVRGNRAILLLVLIAIVPTFLGQPYIHLLTLFAHDVFKIGPAGLGFITSCAGAGSILGGLLVASMSLRSRHGTTMIIFLIAFGVLLLCFALNPVFVLAPAILVGVGAMHIAYNATNNTILQMSVDDKIRGRVLSVLFLNRGLVQLGTAMGAILSALIGPQFALAGMATMIIVFGTALIIWSPTVRNLKV